MNLIRSTSLFKSIPKFNFILSTLHESLKISSKITSSNNLYLQFKSFDNKNKFYFSSSEQQQQKKVTVPFKGYLSIRNSQNMDLAFQTSQKMINFLISKNSIVQEVNTKIKQQLNADNVYLVCNQAKAISQLTPFEALLDRNFFLIINNDYSVKVQGQLLRPAMVNSNIQNFQNLQIPLSIRKDIQSYFNRINTWIQAKYGAGFQSSTVKIPKNEAKKMLIQSLVDPLESTSRITKKEQQFQRVYWQVQELLDKKNEAAIQCSKIVRNRMSIGILLIMCNVGFIWSGTYVYYSWDIIEPIAYFISSIAGIILASRFFKIRRPFSLMNYKQYMISKYMPRAMQKVGLDVEQLNNKEKVLLELQAQIKDYYLKRL